MVCVRCGAENLVAIEVCDFCEQPLYSVNEEQPFRPSARMSKRFYPGSLGFCIVMEIFIAVILEKDPAQLSSLKIEPQGFLILLAIYQTIVELMFIYKAWAAIESKYARTTPGKAVGLLLVPVYNIYWLFQVVGGFASDYNKYVETRYPHAARLSVPLYFIAATVSVVQILANFYAIANGLSLNLQFMAGAAMLQFIEWTCSLLVMNSICNAINALPEEEEIFPRKRKRIAASKVR